MTEPDYPTELDMGEQEQIRLAKLERMRQMGIDPYPPRSERTHMAADAIAAFEANHPAPINTLSAAVG